MNPYQPPLANDKAEDTQESKAPMDTKLVSLVLPVILGAVVGSAILRPYVQGVGDPRGSSIGAGVGGFIGLTLATVGRVFLDRSRVSARTVLDP